MAAVTICSDFGAPQNKVSHCFHCSHLFAVKWWDQMPWSSFSAIRVVSSVHLRVLVFLLAILIPVYASSSLASLMMYSAYKLNKQDDSIQPWCTPFLIWNQSGSNCCFLTCIQISQEAVKVVWYSHVFKNFLVCCDPYSQRLWCSQYRSRFF